MNDEDLNTVCEMHKGFTLPEGYTWNRSYEGGILKSARVFDQNRKLNAKLFYAESGLNGLCEFYEKGSLKEKRMYLNDVADGWGCTVENGREKQWFMYKDGVRISIIGEEDHDGYRLETSLKTGEILSKCKYNSNHKPTGIAYWYENGKVSKEVDVDSGTVLKDYTIHQEKISDITDNSILIQRVRTNDVYEGYVIHAGYSYNPTYVDDKLEGMIPVYDNHKQLVAKLHYHDNLLEDISEFYKDGVLNERRSYKHNMAEGWGSIIENGEEVLWLFYKNGKRVAVFPKIKNTSFRREIDLSSGLTLTIAEYNTERQLHGTRYQFRNGAIETISNYVNGKEQCVLKFFEGDEMSEFSDSQLVYKGQYSSLSEFDYHREKEGKEYANGYMVYFGEWKMNQRNGKGCSYSNDRVFYSGYWKEGLPNGEGVILDENGKEVCEGTWTNGVLSMKNGKIDYPFHSEGEQKVHSVAEVIEASASQEVGAPTGDYFIVEVVNSGTIKTTLSQQSIGDPSKKHVRWKPVNLILGIVILLLLLIGGICLILQVTSGDKVFVVRSKKEFEKLKDSVRFIQVPSDSCNEREFTVVDFSRFTMLEGVVVENNCFKHVKKVQVTNLSCLKRLQIGRNAFSSQEFSSSLSVENKEFVLKNCSSLMSIQIAPYSFSDYASFSIESGI